MKSFKQYVDEVENTPDNERVDETLKITREEVKDKYDEGEYDREGDMAKSDLRSIIANAKSVHDMLDDADNLPEWVQSKITLAEDYISTVANYMTSEMTEQAGQVDEVSTAYINKQAPDYASRASKQSELLKKKVYSIFKDTSASPEEKQKYMNRKKGLISYRKKASAEYEKKHPTPERKKPDEDKLQSSFRTGRYDDTYGT